MQEVKTQKKTVKVHNFQESLAKGQKAEAEWIRLFNETHPGYTISRADGRGHDFVVHSPLGEFTLELKVDSYSMLKTENLFMERYSVFEKLSLGGPWQAQSKSVDLFCYYFSTEQVMLTFNTNKLVTALDSMQLNEKKLVPIFNRGYTTKGWKVPRKDLYEKGIITYCHLNPAFISLR